jgi:hypothetical protein
MIAFVRGVIAASTASGSMEPVVGSTSTNTGAALTFSTEVAVARKVYAGTITSSPLPTPIAASAICNDTVPFDTARPCRASWASANARSKASLRSPATSLQTPS